MDSEKNMKYIRELCKFTSPIVYDAVLRSAVPVLWMPSLKPAP